MARSILSFSNGFRKRLLTRNLPPPITNSLNQSGFEAKIADISQVMNKSEASCKMMYSRAIGKLRSEVPLAFLVYLVTYL